MNTHGLEESATVRRINAQCAARYQHIYSGVIWRVCGGAGDEMELENIEGRREWRKVSELSDPDCWRRMP